MGIIGSKEERLQKRKNSKIDEEMRAEAELAKSIVKLLLLGAGESGKSTILKQMRILHDHGFTEEEYRQQTSVVYCNIIQSMLAILKAMDILDIHFGNADRELDANTVFEHVRRNGDISPFSPETANALKRLWADKGLQKCYHRSSEYQLNDSAKYFLDELDRIGRRDYIPTEQDLLRTRVRTTGIVEVKFQLKGLSFRVFDVGGQRSERKKWIHCFEGVNAIIFITAMSEYDQVLVEDGKTNRMVESIYLFDSICNSIWFVDSSMILFLNKKDIFVEKIKNVPLTVCFPEYTGAQAYEGTTTFIKHKFSSVNKNPKKQIYSHETCATDTNQVQFVLDSSLDIIVTKNLKGCGLY